MVLSTCIGVGGCGCPISISVQCMTVVSYPFSKAAAISHLAAEDTIFLSIIYKLYIGSLSFGAALDKSLMKLINIIII